MRQVRVLIIGLLVAVALAVTLHAQNYVWSSINGVPYAPVAKFGSASVAIGGMQFGGTVNASNNYVQYDNSYFGLAAYDSNNLCMYLGLGVAGSGSPIGPCLVNQYGIAMTRDSWLAWAGQYNATSSRVLTLYRAADGVLQVAGADNTSQGAILASRSVEAVTTTKSPSVGEANEVYTNEGDADGATITLPTAAAGLTYTACIQAAQTLTVTAAAGDTIRLASGVTAAAGSISSNVIGSCVTLVAINATEWYGTSIVGSWSY